MFLSKIILSVVLIFVAAFPAQAQKSAEKDWSVADYFERLPEKYITAHGDYANGRIAAAKLFVDEKNGYAVQMDSPPGASDNPYPIFEIALFKSQTMSPLVVVSNRQNDHVCTEYETFFLRRVGGKWTEAKREVLPPMNLKMFWDEPQSTARLLKIVKQSAVSYHFEPPREGTRMKASLEICDFLEDDAPEEAAKELAELVETARPIRLEWDKQKGKFNLAK